MDRRIGLSGRLLDGVGRRLQTRPRRLVALHCARGAVSRGIDCRRESGCQRVERPERGPGAFSNELLGVASGGWIGSPAPEDHDEDEHAPGT